ncbi:hypothetical protein GCM10009821_06380 [Aeromicrobium halocynthiae]|uniref:DUF2567 domain-containing protein n=1 Tax=Aeromicrobium halocynthiae TaxID=560557 RepID=A0ABN2VSU7_9ACTN
MYVGAVLALASGALFLLDLGLVREAMYVDIDPADPTFGPEYDAFVDAFVVAIGALTVLWGLVAACAWVWMAVMNRRGRAWARIVATALGGVNVLTCLASLGTGVVAQAAPNLLGPTPGVGPVALVVTGVYLLVSVAAMALLWPRRVTEHVRAVSAQRRWQDWQATHGRGGSQ